MDKFVCMGGFHQLGSLIRAARFLLGFVLVLTAGGGAAAVRAAEVIPPAPRAYFNDQAGFVSPTTARELNARLEAFERESSTQLLVATYPRMLSDSSVSDYTRRVAESWRVGQARRDNGAVLFLFRESRDAYLQVGYGLEGALPDILAKRIVEEEILSAFRQGDFDAGLRRGVEAMIAATRGEYVGTGRTVADARSDPRGQYDGDPVRWMVLVFFVVIIVISIVRGRRSQRYVLGPSGQPVRGAWSVGGGGGRVGGSGGSDKGGFSGGGGRFGGGGAGGRW